MQLPMWQFRQEVVDIVEKSQVVIICGETGWYAPLLSLSLLGPS